MMSDIFLSYASEDREQGRLLAEALTQAGWSVFWDRTIASGKIWQEVLEEELAAAQGLVVIWSVKAVKRKWVIDEVEEGIRQRVPIFQVLIERVRPPLEFRSRQAVNLSAWDGSANAYAFQNLVRNIRNSLGQPGRVEPSQPTTQETREPKPSESKPAAAPTELAPQDTRELTNSLGMRFKLIPAGIFLRGRGTAEDGDEDERPQHQVTLSRPFYLQTTPVTQGQWTRLMGRNPALFQECGEDCPVEDVSWDDTQDFIRRLNQIEKTDKYRLPTEAEWEYACRAGSAQSYCFGDGKAELEQYAWYADNSRQSTHPVGRLRPNAWGLYDMHGNVYEWCQD